MQKKRHTEDTLQTEDSLEEDSSSIEGDQRDTSQLEKQLDTVVQRIEVFKALYLTKKPFFM